MHGVQAVSPPLLLHRFAQFRLIGELLGRLYDLLLQRESAFQVSQEGVLFSSAETVGTATAPSPQGKPRTKLSPHFCFSYVIAKLKAKVNFLKTDWSD